MAGSLLLALGGCSNAPSTSGSAEQLSSHSQTLGAANLSLRLVDVQKRQDTYAGDWTVSETKETQCYPGAKPVPAVDRATAD